jgi:hypothetical protein
MSSKRKAARVKARADAQASALPSDGEDKTSDSEDKLDEVLTRLDEREKKVDGELAGQKAELTAQSGKIANVTLKLDTLGEAFTRYSEKADREALAQKVQLGEMKAKQQPSWIGSWSC